MRFVVNSIDPAVLINSSGSVNIGGQYTNTAHSLAVTKSNGNCIVIGNSSGSGAGSHDAQIVASDGSNFNNLKIGGHETKVFANVSGGTGYAETWRFNSSGNLKCMIAGKGIDFSSADDTATGETISSSVLDDFEEGTYTPTITNLGNHTTNSSNTYGAYTKIGDLVTVRFRYQWTGRSTTNGAYNVYVSLPFSGANVKIPGHGSCGVEGCQPNSSDRTSYHSSVPQSASYVQFRCSGANISENSFSGAISTALSSGYFMGAVSYKTT